MRIFLSRAAVLAGALILFAAPVFVAVPAQAAELRLAYDTQPLPPLIVGEGVERPAKPGAAIELVQRVLSGSDHRLVLTRVPAARLLDDLKGGRLDGAIAVPYTAAYADSVIYPMLDSRPDRRRHLATLGYSFYRLKSGSAEWNGQTLRNSGGPIGIVTGAGPQRDLRGLRLPITEMPSSRQLFDLLARGGIGVAAIFDPIGEHYLGMAGGEEIVKLAPPLQTQELYVAFARSFHGRNPGLVDEFWRQLAQQNRQVYRDVIPDYLF